MAKQTKRTPKRDGIFFAALASGKTITEACKKAGYRRATIYEWKDVHPAFAAAFAEADDQAVDRMEAEADRRAIVGTLKPVFHKGTQCGSVREFSDTLLMFRLKAKRPDRYRENSKVEHSGGVKIVRLPAKESDTP